MPIKNHYTQLCEVNSVLEIHHTLRDSTQNPEEGRDVLIDWTA